MDSSVLLSRYLAEPRSREAAALISQPTVIALSRVTRIEVLRGLSFVDSSVERTTTAMLFEEDWRRAVVLDLDGPMADLATAIATQTGVRSLDAIHIAAAVRARAEAFITFDQRQAEAARTFDLTVLGVDE